MAPKRKNLARSVVQSLPEPGLKNIQKRGRKAATDKNNKGAKPNSTPAGVEEPLTAQKVKQIFQKLIQAERNKQPDSKRDAIIAKLQKT